MPILSRYCRYCRYRNKFEDCFKEIQKRSSCGFAVHTHMGLPENRILQIPKNLWWTLFCSQWNCYRLWILYTEFSDRPKSYIKLMKNKLPNISQKKTRYCIQRYRQFHCKSEIQSFQATDLCLGLVVGGGATPVMLPAAEPAWMFRMNSTTRLLHQAEICGFVQTGIREGYQAKKRGQPKIFYRYYGIVYGDLLGIYAFYFLANTLITLELLREPCFRAVIVTAKHAFVCQWWSIYGSSTVIDESFFQKSL
jgi:hypothetical protein